jgi:hypothetical protein
LSSPEAPSRNDYDLRPVLCPGTFRAKDGKDWPCPNLIDRREVLRDLAVHEYKCPRCLCLYTYRFNADGEVVVLSMQQPPPRRGHG